MADKITVTFELDADLKAEAEKLYSKIHLTLEEAIPLLIKYNVEQDENAIAKRKTKPKQEDKISAFGALAEYANPAMIPFESCALERAAVERYVRSLD